MRALTVALVLVSLHALAQNTRPDPAMESAARHAAEAEAQLIASNPGLAALDAKNGFRDVKFGAELPKDGWSKVGTEGGMDFYVRATDKLSIGRAQLDSISYAVWKGRIVGVALVTKGAENHAAMLDAFTAAYGEPEQPNRLLEEYRWKSSAVVLFVEVQIGGRMARAAMLSLPAMLEMNAEREAAATAAGQDL